MEKRIRNGLVGMLIAGAVAVSGAVCSLRNRDLEEGWKRCEVYTESPSYPDFLQKNVFDKIKVGLDNVYEHPESDKVQCDDWKYPNEETWHNSCNYRLVSKEEDNAGLRVKLVEDQISPDIYRFSILGVSGFENDLERLKEIIGKSPWIFEAAVSGGYVVSNVRDENRRIVEKDYELANGKKIVAVDSNKDGRLDRYRGVIE